MSKIQTLYLVFSCELAPVPKLTILVIRDARYPMNKFVLINKLKAEVSSCSIELDAVLIDSGGVLHKLHWPTDGHVFNNNQAKPDRSDLR